MKGTFWLDLEKYHASFKIMPSRKSFAKAGEILGNASSRKFVNYSEPYKPQKERLYTGGSRLMLLLGPGKNSH